jgi:hypothetical protein
LDYDNTAERCNVPHPNEEEAVGTKKGVRKPIVPKPLSEWRMRDGIHEWQGAKRQCGVFWMVLRIAAAGIVFLKADEEWI